MSSTGNLQGKNRFAGLRERAECVLAGGPATLSKHWGRFPQGIAPAFLSEGQDAAVWDVEGRRYLDASAALGPVLLGHGHLAVTDAVWTQAERLASSSLSTALEVEVAEMLVDIIPGAEQVRFACNGKDVTEAAVKLTRYVTGHQHAVYLGYHGGFADYLITTEKCGGILPQIQWYNHQVPWGDTQVMLKVLGEIGTDLACLMVEVPPRPVDEDPSVVTQELQWLMDMAHQHQGMFVLDEIVSGFRYAVGGAQAAYGITADLATFSKGMANGYPCAALTGPRALMEAFEGGKVFLSTTFGANPIGLAACQATLRHLQETPALKRLQYHGQALCDHIIKTIADFGVPASLRGNFARMVLDWHETPGIATAAQWRTLWLQELLRHGVLASVPWLPMTCYTTETVQELAMAINSTCVVLQEVMRGRLAMTEALQCPVIDEVFGQRYATQERI